MPRRKYIRTKKAKHPIQSLKMTGRLAEKASNWKGGNIRIDGIKYLYMPGHPNAKFNKTYIQESRFVMSEYLGRTLASNEIVHHINRDPDDNRIENLQLLTRAEHNKEHQIFSAINRSYKVQMHRRFCPRDIHGRFTSK